MRGILVGMAALLFTVAAWATPTWSEPGWYEVDDTMYGPVVATGPFPDEASCRQQLPPDDAEAGHDCKYLSERPSWDE